MSGVIDGTVWKAKSSQRTLLTNRERVSADPDFMKQMGIEVGQQIRILNKANGEMALFTYAEARQESREGTIRMGYDGRTRLGQTTTPIEVSVRPQGPHPTFTESQARSGSELIEVLDEADGCRGDAWLCAIAPHGGTMEDCTDEQAEQVFGVLRAARRPVDCWRCKAWKSGGGSFHRWHIASTDIDRRSFPKLDSIANKNYRFCVAFHGYKGNDLIIGGCAPTDLKKQTQRQIAAVLAGTGLPVIVQETGANAGTSPANLVNWLCGGKGIQIEQPYVARKHHWREIANAVASVFLHL